MKYCELVHLLHLTGSRGVSVCVCVCARARVCVLCVCVLCGGVSLGGGQLGCTMQAWVRTRCVCYDTHTRTWLVWICLCMHVCMYVCLILQALKGYTCLIYGYVFHSVEIHSHAHTHTHAHAHTHTQVRVVGGAYGGFCSFDPHSGNFAYLSYRDPNLLETLEAYDGSPEYLKTLDLTQEELTKVRVRVCVGGCVCACACVCVGVGAWACMLRNLGPHSTGADRCLCVGLCMCVCLCVCVCACCVCACTRAFCQALDLTHEELTKQCLRL